MASKTDKDAGAEIVSNHKKNTVPKQIPKINRVLQAIEGVDLDRIKQPEYQEVFNDQNVSEVIDNIFLIINKYRKEGLRARIGNIDDDLIMLSALLVTLSMHSGAMQGHSFYLEENLKIMSASTYAKANELASQQNINLTGGDHTALSRMTTKTEREKRVASESANKVLTNIYYTVRQFIDVLSGLASRYYSNQ